MSKRKYQPGEVIHSMDRLCKSEFVYCGTKIQHRGWVQSWQIGMAYRMLQAGHIREAILIPERNEIEPIFNQIMGSE